MTRKFIATLFVLILTTLTGAQTATRAQTQTTSPGTHWSAVDDLGRARPEPQRELRDDRKVGLFYFLWFEPSTVAPRDKNSDEPRPYDISKIERIDPNPTQNDALLGKEWDMHYWGEPLFGYYDARDPFVIRRHMQLIADAGIDVLIFDVTNLSTYPDVYLPLCDLLLEMRAQGFHAPQVAFMTNTLASRAIEALWKDFYSKERYRPLFFLWRGKPPLLAPEKDAPESVRDFFTIRTAYWPTGGPKNTRNEWHWVDAYPQPYAWSDEPDRPEELVVSTAQNLSRDAGAHDVWMSERIGRGRSFVFGADRQRYAPDEGLNFAQQWSRALELDPEFLLVTGWNEWTAQRLKIDWAGGRYAFVDQFDHEFSRDVEPTRALHTDAYYLQMVDGIRRFKGGAPAPSAAPRKRIALDAGFEQWLDVTPELRDYVDDPATRDFNGRGGAVYRNASGRNDLESAKVARDDEYVYFYLKTTAPITPNPPDGLRLALDLDDDLTTGWRGADALIGDRYLATGASVARYNPEPAASARARMRELTAEFKLDEALPLDGLVERQTQAYATPEQTDALAQYDEAERAKVAARREVEALKETARRWHGADARTTGAVAWRVERDQLMLAVPLALFAKGQALDAVSFKWLDNLPEDPSAVDFYDHGDVAPEGAFFYRVTFAKE